MKESVKDRMRREIMRMFAPPPEMTVSEWAEKNRFLSSETSAAAGRWKNDKAPYQTPIMDAFTQRGVEEIVIMSGAQCGKSEILMNMMGRCIDLDPAPMMMVQPSQNTADDFSKQRIAAMVDCCPILKKKVRAPKTRVSSNTIRLKAFPGGSLVIASAQSATELRSKPVRFLFLDEVDAYPASVGGEGDPVDLATARTETFYNRRIVKVSTPTIEGRSAIEKAYRRGTQEEWCKPCPQCGAFFFMRLADFVYEYDQSEAGGRAIYRIKSVRWRCPGCQSEHTEREMARQEGRYIARNPDALENGVRSFHLNAFVSPWAGWKRIIRYFLEAKGDPAREQAFTNIRLGECWQESVERLTTAEEIYARREEYSAEVPDGVLALTMGVDTQDNRLEFEVIGWGREHENWRIMRGIIPGRPDEEKGAVWKELDKLLERRFRRRDGKALRILTTFIDSGGHFTDVVYRECAKRAARRVFAIKGEGGEGKEYVRMSSAMKKQRGLYLFILGVDVGKEQIAYSLNVKEAGPWYSHFPAAPEAGYTLGAIRGLFSEKMELKAKGGRSVAAWVKDPTVSARNEPLDCANYAQAAFQGFQIDLDAIERRLRGEVVIKKESDIRKKQQPRAKMISGGI